MEGAEGAAAVGAASPGAPEGREKKIEHPKGSSRDASLSSDCKSPSRQASDVEVQVRDYTWESDAEPEAAREAASGAFGALPPDLRGTSAGDQARASTADRQVHFCDARWPVLRGARFCSQKKLQLRRQRILELAGVFLQRESWPVPNAQAFQDGISDTLSGERCEGANFDVARAFASQKVHFRGLLGKKLEGERDNSQRALLLRSIPELGTCLWRCSARGVRGRRPIWETLRRTWRVHACHDFLTTHLCDKHDDGEVRLLSQKDMRASAVGRRRPQPGLLVAPAREGRGVATAAQGETCD